jgi:RNA polymerase sigma factor (sigma-70 family)
VRVASHHRQERHGEWKRITGKEQVMSNLGSVTSASDSSTAVIGDFERSSDTRLLAAAKDGQRSAFGELCNRHADKLFRVTHRITRNREDAEDSVQDSFLSAFVHLKDFDGRSQFVTWLTRIAINSALAKLRKKRGIREIPMDEPSPSGETTAFFEVADSGPDPEEQYRRREREQIVTAAIDGLKPKARSVVEIHQIQERSLKETAQVLGISAAAAKARMFHARAALRRMPLLKGMGGSHWATAG